MKTKPLRDSLKKNFHPKARKDYIDYDYIHKLNPEELAWLRKFTDEMYGAAFDINPTYIIENGKYVQISGNKNRNKNRDLRKYRKVQKYYKLNDNTYTTDTKYKYANTNIHKGEQIRLNCNKNANAIGRDILSKEQVVCDQDYLNKIIDENNVDLSTEERVSLKDFLIILKKYINPEDLG